MMYYQRFSANTKKLLSLLVSVLLAFLLLFIPATCSASGTQEADRMPAITYQITEQELVQQLSVTQQAELTRLRAQLQKSQMELQLLKNQLNTSSVQLTIAQQSLQNANQSLQKYAREEKKKRLKIKAQRNIWVGASILLAAIAIVK